MHLSGPRQRIVAIIALTGASLAGVRVPAHADPIPRHARYHGATITSGDGTPLHADVFLPRALGAGDKVPVIVTVSPYLNPTNERPLDPIGFVGNPLATGPVAPYADLVKADIWTRGYAYVGVSLRGFGVSGGCTDFMGPGEQGDVKAAVEWAARQPWSTGKVTIWGLSYDGWAGVAALATHPRGLAAAIIESPLITTYRGLMMNGNRYYSPFWYAIASLYAESDLQPPPLTSPPSDLATWLGSPPANANCYAVNSVDSSNTDPNSAFWQQRNLISRAAGSTVPVLWSHGFLDDAVRPDNFADVWTTLAGPHRAWFGQYWHTFADIDEFPGAGPHEVGRHGFLDEALRWVDHFALGSGGVPTDPPVEVEDSQGRWRSESQWPPADVTPWTLGLRSGSYVDAAFNRAQPRYGLGAPLTLEREGVGSWTFSRPFASETRISGIPRVTVDVDAPLAGYNVIALAYDISTNGSARLLTRGARVASRSGRLSFDLYPQDADIAAGHRIGVLVTGSADDTFTPGTTLQTVRLRSGSVVFPVLASRRTPNLDGVMSAAARQLVEFPVAAATIAARTSPSALPPS